ncbi:hypothetical protein AB1Y20_017476 [Prymnesium parvum]|uniref:FAD-binding domain-containing protein n=1 Tax=Prymnesium parvum TaxID=97485 RepID=A0AB34JP74_PRYPA
MAVRRTGVLIVGGGPVGLYASSLLSAYGVPSLLAERSVNRSTHPRAHLINSRSMELLRQLGLEPAVRAHTPPLHEWSHFRYCTSLLGEEIAAQDHTASAAWRALSAASSSSLAHLSQPKLERLLRSEAEARAAPSGAELLDGYRLVDLAQHAGGVRATLLRDGEPSVAVECDELLACDGAHSTVRRALGLELRGPPVLQHFHSVHFSAPALAAALRARPAMLYFVFNPRVIAVLVAHNLAEGEWVAQLPFFPPLQPAEPDPSACHAAIAACLGGGAPRFEVRSISRWAMSALVAQRLSIGRVHLLGDAAHQFPPAGALGANTGLADAHNLCWKIAAAAGGAPRALVESYDAERRPLARRNARLAVHNYHRGLRVSSALGLPSALPHAIGRALGRLPGGGAPPALAAGAAEALLSLGRRALLGGPPLLGRHRRAAAAAVVESGGALPLLFARHELGYRYCEAGAAVVGARADEGAADRTVEEMEDEAYTPSSAAGCRLPHVWLSDYEGARVSTHDLLHAREAGARMAGGAPALTLLIDALGGKMWTSAAKRLPGARLQLVAIACEPDSAARETEADAYDASGEWARRREVTPSGALLVRPDGHVAWRCDSLEDAALASEREVGEALHAVLRTLNWME